MKIEEILRVSPTWKWRWKWLTVADRFFLPKKCQRILAQSWQTLTFQFGFFHLWFPDCSQCYGCYGTSSQPTGFPGKFLDLVFGCFWKGHLFPTLAMAFVDLVNHNPIQSHPKLLLHCLHDAPSEKECCSSLGAKHTLLRRPSYSSRNCWLGRKKHWILWQLRSTTQITMACSSGNVGKPMVFVINTLAACVIFQVYDLRRLEAQVLFSKCHPPCHPHLRCCCKTSDSCRDHGLNLSDRLWWSLGNLPSALMGHFSRNIHHCQLQIAPSISRNITIANRTV